MSHDKLFIFDDLKIKLINIQKKNIDFCIQYFDDYLNQTINNNSRPNWTIQINNSPDKTREGWETDEQNKYIKVICHKSNSVFIMRIIRSIKILEDVKNNRLVLKGSCIATKDGLGLVILGPRRSGKTSLILSYLLREGCGSAFISNSVVSLIKTNNHYQAFGYPMAIGVRNSVSNSLISQGNIEFQQLLPITQNNFQREDGRYYLDPPHLKKYLNGRISTSTPVKAIIILKNIPSKQTFGIRKLINKEIKTIIAKYQSQYFNKNNGSWYNLFQVDIKNQKKLIREMTNHIDCYELKYNIRNHTKSINILNKI